MQRPGDKVTSAKGYDFETIFTLEGRGNVLLELASGHLGVSDARMFVEIRHAFEQAKAILASKSVDYRNLKRALVPSSERHERAYAFRSTRIGAANYGYEVHKWLVPLWSRQSTNSVLCGDWIVNEKHNEWLCDNFAESLRGGSERYRGAGRDLFFVYLNNLSTTMAAEIHEGLKQHDAYLGYLDLDAMSPMKGFLSTFLARAYVKHKSVVLQPHEDDVPSSEDVDSLGYGWAKWGYSNKSVPSWLYGLFLSYKIERPVGEGEVSDAKYSLNALSTRPTGLDRLRVNVEERKLRYLKDQKIAAMSRSGLSALSAREVAEKIQAKIRSGYIYNMAWATNGGTVKFNVMLEWPGGFRTVASLEYRAAEGEARLITFY